MQTFCAEIEECFASQMNRKYTEKTKINSETWKSMQINSHKQFLLFYRSKIDFSLYENLIGTDKLSKFYAEIIKRKRLVTEYNNFWQGTNGSFESKRLRDLEHSETCWMKSVHF